MTTPVIFRRFKEGDILALFPAEPADTAGFFCGSYAHIGQHSGADYNAMIAQSKPATPVEYADLKVELENIGYDDLKVYRRSTPQIREQFLAELRR